MCQVTPFPSSDGLAYRKGTALSPPKQLKGNPRRCPARRLEGSCLVALGCTPLSTGTAAMQKGAPWAAGARRSAHRMSAGPAQGPTSHRKQLDAAGAEGQRESAERGVQERKRSNRGGSERGDRRILETRVKPFQKQEQRTSSPRRGPLEVLRVPPPERQRGQEKMGPAPPSPRVCTAELTGAATASGFGTIV